MSDGLEDGGVRGRILALIALGTLLTGFFIYLGFPYDLVGARFEAAIERGYGVELDLGELGPRVGLLGPALEASPVRATTPDGFVLVIDRARARPAWSLSWFRGRPAFYTELEGPLGYAEGVLTLGEPPNWSGQISELKLSRLPLDGVLPGSALDGIADVELALSFEPAGPTGPVHFEAREGSIEHPDLPLALPFERAVGDLVLGGDHLAELLSAELQSPLGSGTLSGTLGHAPQLENSPLALDLKFTASSEVLKALGVGRNAEVEKRIVGTLSRWAQQ